MAHVVHLVCRVRQADDGRRGWQLRASEPTYGFRYHYLDDDEDRSGGSDGGLSDVTGSTTDITWDNDNGTVPKPPGEVGRPGRGGYNLKAKLGWPCKEYSNFRVRPSSVDNSSSTNHSVPENRPRLYAEALGHEAIV